MVCAACRGWQQWCARDRLRRGAPGKHLGWLARQVYQVRQDQAEQRVVAPAVDAALRDASVYEGGLLADAGREGARFGVRPGRDNPAQPVCTTSQPRENIGRAYVNDHQHAYRIRCMLCRGVHTL